VKCKCSCVEAECLKIQLAFLVAPPVVQPQEVGSIGQPADRPGEQPTIVLVGHKADPVHSVHDRIIRTVEFDNSGDVGKVDTVRAATREVGPLDAAFDAVPQDGPFTSAEHLKKGTVIQFDELSGIADVSLLRRIQQFRMHKPTLRNKRQTRPNVPLCGGRASPVGSRQVNSQAGRRV